MMNMLVFLATFVAVAASQNKKQTTDAATDAVTTKPEPGCKSNHLGLYMFTPANFDFPGGIKSFRKLLNSTDSNEWLYIRAGDFQANEIKKIECKDVNVNLEGGSFTFQCKNSKLRVSRQDCKFKEPWDTCTINNIDRDEGCRECTKLDMMKLLGKMPAYCQQDLIERMQPGADISFAAACPCYLTYPAKKDLSDVPYCYPKGGAPVRYAYKTCQAMGFKAWKPPSALRIRGDRATIAFGPGGKEFIRRTGEEELSFGANLRVKGDLRVDSLVIDGMPLKKYFAGLMENLMEDE